MWPSRLFNAANARMSLVLAGKRRVCLHYETALVVLELLEDLAAPARDTGERVVGDVDGHLGGFGDARVEPAEEGAAAGEVDALVHDVCDELGRRLFDGVLDRIDDLVDGRVQRFADLRTRDLDGSRETCEQVASAKECGHLFVERVRGADR